MLFLNKDMRNTVDGALKNEKKHLELDGLFALFYRFFINIGYPGTIGTNQHVRKPRLAFQRGQWRR